MSLSRKKTKVEFGYFGLFMVAFVIFWILFFVNVYVIHWYPGVGIIVDGIEYTEEFRIDNVYLVQHTETYVRAPSRTFYHLCAEVSNDNLQNQRVILLGSSENQTAFDEALKALREADICTLHYRVLKAKNGKTIVQFIKMLDPIVAEANLDESY